MTSRILPLIAVAGLVSMLPLRSIHAGQIAPTPRATPLPITATNRPFLGARNALQPVDLAARGYVEEELAVSGSANIYDWSEPGAKDAVRVRTPHVPYTTRILVRRPADVHRASGRVIVELLNPTGEYDIAPLWGLSAEYFLRHGDIWVGATIKPVAVEALKRFDAVRYADLSFAYRQPADCTAPPAQAENGLAWDITAQLGALLRSSSKENPLAAYDVRRLIAAGYSQTGGYIVTYVNALHDALRLGNDHPVYDAYVDAAGAMVPAPINQCAPALAPEDPRLKIGPRDAPLVTVMTQSDFARALGARRADSDDPADRYRLYEVAGAAHVGPIAAGQPSAADLQIAGFRAPDAAACAEAPSHFPLGYAFNGIWAQLEDWLVRDVPMQHASPIGVDAKGQVQLDAKGNAIGGLRLPQIAVPLAAYAGFSTPRKSSDADARVCALTGSERRFDPGELKALYGTRAAYLKRFNAEVAEAQTARWLDAADAAAAKAQAAQATPAF